jgi:hypothetical protein
MRVALGKKLRGQVEDERKTKFKLTEETWQSKKVAFLDMY